MTPEIIPTDLDNPNYQQRTSLSGTDYLLSFLYSERECRWYFSMADADGAPIISGKKMVVNWDLMRLVTDSRRPAGEIVALDLSGQVPARDPQLADLGRRVKLFYFKP